MGLQKSGQSHLDTVQPTPSTLKAKPFTYSKAGESTRIPGTGETRARLFAGKTRVAPVRFAGPRIGIV
jgi:hypothetical protein